MRIGRLKSMLWLAVLVALKGCGGGGGGETTGEEQGDLPTLVYSGNTGVAIVTATNAARLVTGFFGGDLDDGVTAPAALSIQPMVPTKNASEGISFQARRLKERFLESLSLVGAAGVNPEIASAVTPINSIEPCDSGTVRTVGTLNDDGTGAVAVRYSNCRTGDETLNGQIHFRTDVYDFAHARSTDYTLTFTRLTFRRPNESFDFGGSFRYQTDFAARTETTTMNAVFLDNRTGKISKLENFVIVEVYDNIFSPTSVTETDSGRMFDQVHGYVDIATSVPLFYSDLNQSIPDNGQISLVGDLNRKVRTTVLSTVLAKMELDLDGDGNFETEAYAKWNDLSGAIGDDLGDNDGDGVHNAWETANGLNSNDPADALLDNDGDGANNLVEYRSGTEINNAGSLPPTADLSVSISDSPDPATTAANLRYTITVSNPSSLAAENVVVSDNIPASVNFVSVTPQQGSCTGTTSIVCDLGTLNGFNSVDIVLIVIPQVAALIDNTASVVSSTFDINLVNNSAQSTTTVDLPPPPVSDLSLTLDVPEFGFIGVNVSYTIRISNQGVSPAENVVVTDTLPASWTLISATPSRGNCTGTSVVSCTLGTLVRFEQALITLVVSPNAGGVISNTASVTTSTIDSDSTNNNATALLTVRKSLSAVQALIDSASPGDTILVDPGNYGGHVDFRSKDITLQSQSGPAVTILNGNGGTVAHIGPGGVMKGFTVTGSSSDFGGAIAIVGAGSIVSENVFDGNGRIGGQIGVAISGNVVSPIIDRNLFRNNICSAELFSGVIAFTNGDSASITNNVFENNACQVLNVSGMPNVVNNTFVGNPTAIRINVFGPGTSQTFRNNLIVQGGVGLDASCGTCSTFNYAWENNLVFGNTTDYLGVADPTGANGNISADPMFVNSGASNYRLQTGSPAIDTGSAIGAPTIDFDGTVRPLDGNGDGTPVVDIGAFEAP